MGHMLNLGTLKIPINAAVKTFGVIAKKGAGKTFCSAVLAEEFHKAGVPFVVFDPIDVWWGLRLSADGKKPGIPVVVFGIEHADIKLTRDMGAQIAQSIVRDNISCVISTFGMTKADARKIILDFSEEIMRINNTPRHIFIEEAPEYLPQRVWGGIAQCFAAVEAIVRMGRNRSLGVTLISQRAATIHKDVLTQIDTLIALRLLGPQDRNALEEWVRATEAEGDFDKFIKSLPSLPTGEAWVWSPEFLGIFERIKIRKRETFHPNPEKRDAFVLPNPHAADINSFIDRFTSEIVVPEEGSKKKGKIEHKDPVPQMNERPAYDLKLANEEIRKIKNEYESLLVAANVRADRAEQKLRQIATLIGSTAAPVAGDPLRDNMQLVSGVVNNETNLVLQKLGGMAQAMYKKLLEHPAGLTSRQLALMCGYGMSGSFRNARAKLKTMGLIKYEGELVIPLTR